MDYLEVLERIGSETDAPTDTELSEAKAELERLVIDAAAKEAFDEGKTLKQAIKFVDDEFARRAKAAEEKAAQAAELLEGIDDPDASDPEAEETEPEPEPEPEDATDALEAIRLAAANRRASIDADAEPPNPSNVRVVAVGHAEVERLDHTATVGDIANLFSQYARGKGRGRETLVRMLWEMEEDRTLDADVGRSHRIIEDVLGEKATTFEAVAAAGGICGPLATVFDIPLIGSRGRPVRDALVRFGADRGGVRYIAAPRPSLNPVAGSVAVWTAENDTSPTSPAEKPCPHVDCGDECTALVDAVTACLIIGNFQAKFSPEQWANALGQLGILHDRIADQALLADIDAGSIAATYAPAGGTIAGVLGAIDRAVAAIRSRERLSAATGFRAVVDGWIVPALRSQFTVQGPHGQTGAPGVSDTQIRQWLNDRGVTVTATADDSIFPAQTAGALEEFPSETTVRVFPEGTWWFLDGGTLDLGTEIVDGDLIAANDRQAFMETFEKATKRTAPCDEPGDDSLSITIPVDDACLNVCAEVTSP